jgi:hypothetical protein
MCIQKFEARHLFVGPISYDCRMSAYAEMGITDVMLLWRFSVDFGSAVRPSHRADVGSVVDVSEAHSVSIFGVEVEDSMYSRMSQTLPTST